MLKTNQIPFLTLILMISFASVNAVLFTPALPAITTAFGVTNGVAQQTITWFLVGYAFGQLLYGPIANRFGRKPALYAGISLQIISSLVCVFAGVIHAFTLLVLGRFLLALGSGVGLKMTFTLVNETQEQKQASQTLSYLMIAFAVTPGLSVMLGGVLNEHFGWTSTFYASAVYGVILLLLATRLPETKKVVDKNALQVTSLIKGYGTQFTDIRLLAGGLLMGSASCFVYVFAAIAPFVAMNLLGMSSVHYGVANLLPSAGLVIGSLYSAHLAKNKSQSYIINLGILIAIIGSLTMIVSAYLQLSAMYILFVPMALCYFGLSLIFANASTIAMAHVTDKSHGSAVMNFVNMGFVTVVVLAVSSLAVSTLLMPTVFMLICAAMLFLSRYVRTHQ